MYAELQTGRTDVLALHEDEKPNVAGISLAVVRAGSDQKGSTLAADLERIGLGTTILQPDWDEDAFRRNPYTGYISPHTCVGLKLTQAHDIRPQAAENPARRGDGLVAQVSSDVDVILGDRPQFKPIGLRADEIEASLQEQLTAGPQPVHIRAATGYYVQEPHIEEDAGRGITRTDTIKTVLTPLSPHEVELYIHGAAGRTGTYPAEIAHILDEIAREHGDTEAQMVAQGMSLADLQASNGGIRLLHPVLRRHLHMDKAMARMLMGLPPGLRTLQDVQNLGLFEGPLSRSTLPVQGNWRERATLGNGSHITLEHIAAEDDVLLGEISALAQRNFDGSPSYTDYPPSVLDKFRRANTPEGLAGTVSAGIANIALAARDERGQVIGFVVARQNEGGVATIKRIHVALGVQGNSGLGSHLLERAVQQAKQNGCTHMDVVASGKSDSFFERKGFAHNGSIQVQHGVFADDDGDKPDCVHLVKDLSTVV